MRMYSRQGASLSGVGSWQSAGGTGLELVHLSLVLPSLLLPLRLRTLGLRLDRLSSSKYFDHQ